jgi:hypothetical protein
MSLLIGHYRATVIDANPVLWGLPLIGREIVDHYRATHPNVNYGGTGNLTGTVKISATPVKRLIRLYDSKTGLLLSSTWAGLDGTYSFKLLTKLTPFTVTSTDYNGIYNDVIAANIYAV